MDQQYENPHKKQKKKKKKKKKNQKKKNKKTKKKQKKTKKNKKNPGCFQFSFSVSQVTMQITTLLFVFIPYVFLLHFLTPTHIVHDEGVILITGASTGG